MTGCSFGIRLFGILPDLIIGRNEGRNFIPAEFLRITFSLVERIGRFIGRCSFRLVDDHGLTAAVTATSCSGSRFRVLTGFVA
jgi:hypothetical protein